MRNSLATGCRISSVHGWVTKEIHMDPLVVN